MCGLGARSPGGDIIYTIARNKGLRSLVGCEVDTDTTPKGKGVGDEVCSGWKAIPQRHGRHQYPNVSVMGPHTRVSPWHS